MSGPTRTGPNPEGIDPGLASERTDLAWNRSGLSLIACGVVVAKGLAVSEPVRARAAVGVTILVLGALTWALGAVQARRRSRPGLARHTARPRDLLPVAVGTASVGIAAFALGLLFPA